MSDLDRLESFARETTLQVLAPDFDSLVRASRRRRLSSVVATGLAAAAAVGVVAIGAQAWEASQSAPGPIGPPTSVTHHPPPPPGPGRDQAAENLVQGSTSYLYRLAISRDNPEFRAAVWGHGSREALAVTADAFVTTHYLPVARFTDLAWAGDDGFLVRLRSGQLVVVSAKGEVRDVTSSDEASPLQASETLFTSFSPRSGEPAYLAVDVFTKTSHPVPVPYPAGKGLQLRQGDGQLIWGTGYDAQGRAEIVSSSDGGATWRDPVVEPDLEQLDPIDSAAPDTLAMIGAGDDDFKLSQELRRSLDGGQTWQAVHPTALRGTSPGWLAVTTDGRLLVWVFDTFKGATLEPGLYESDSTSWLSFHRVSVTSQNGPEGDLRLTVVDASGRQFLYVEGKTGLLVSSDSGRSWSNSADR